MHTNTSPETLRRVTSLFPVFLGLRLLPVGLWFIALAMPLFDPLQRWGDRVLLVVAIVATWAIDRWYRRRYGTVEPKKLRFGRNWALLLGVVAAWVALAVGPRATNLEPVVVLVVLLLFATAIAFALPRAPSGGPWPAGIFLLVAALGGALLVAMPREAAAFGSLGARFSLITGILLVLAGGIEHHLLRRVMHRAVDER